MATINPKKFTSPKMTSLADWLIKAQGGAKTFDPANADNPILKRAGVEVGSDFYNAAMNGTGQNEHKLLAKQLADRQALLDTSEGVSIPQLGKLGMGAASAHPLQTAGGALTTGMNLAGLIDNDKFGGQIGGLALGGLASYGLGLNPGYAYLATTAGGALGSLFDKLRAKREAEAQQAQMYQQAYH